MSNEYKKTCHDELDWVEVEQLHTATVEISKNCFEYKKLCITLLGIGAALIIKFAPDPFTDVNFGVALMICTGFWLADSTAFYYQRSIRRIMSSKMSDIAARNGLSGYTRQSVANSKVQALFNSSMTLYYALIFLVVISWVVTKFS